MASARSEIPPPLAGIPAGTKGPATMDGPASSGIHVGLASGPHHRPVWTGLAPPLAEGFTGRPETGQLTQRVLVPGSALALVPEHVSGPRIWRHAAGKTQLALSFARSLWQAGAVDLVIWLTATSRAQMLSGYAEAASALGLHLPGGAGSAADGGPVTGTRTAADTGPMASARTPA